MYRGLVEIRVSSPDREEVANLVQAIAGAISGNDWGLSEGAYVTVGYEMAERERLADLLAPKATE